jgi:ATP-dependent DNA helicase RecG
VVFACHAPYLYRTLVQGNMLLHPHILSSGFQNQVSHFLQLRGRVGRGSEKSYCILMSKVKMSNDAKARIKIMCETNDGFKIAEKDLEIRGPGDIEGTRQSGELNFKLANIIEDRLLLEQARHDAENIIEADSTLSRAENAGLKNFLQSDGKRTGWSKIS